MKLARRLFNKNNDMINFSHNLVDQVKLKRLPKGSLFNKAFTLTEIVIVLVILAILVGLVVPRFAVFIERGKQQEAINILSQLHGSMLRYFYEHDGLPQTAITELDIDDDPGKYFNAPTMGVPAGDWFFDIERDPAMAAKWDYTVRVNETMVFSYSDGTGPGGLPN